ncbi:hypothetical protein BDZ89DRAFT_1203716 [Hymenopellis radicata]|nr:hypothetical protein BDZ89DRAFT_1203716 [Hymenopellis radicata]
MPTQPDIECTIAQLHQSAVDRDFEEAARLLPIVLTHPEFKPGIDGAAPDPLAPLNNHSNVIVNLQAHMLLDLNSINDFPFNASSPLLFRHLMDTLSFFCEALEVVLSTVCGMFLDCPTGLNTVPDDIKLIFDYFLLISQSTYTGDGVVSLELIIRVIAQVPEMNSWLHDAIRACSQDTVFRGWDNGIQCAYVAFRNCITDRLPPHVLHTNLMCLDVFTLESYFNEALAERDGLMMMSLLLEVKLIARRPSGEEAFWCNLPLMRLSTCIYNILPAHPPLLVTALDSPFGFLQTLARAVDYLGRNPTDLLYSWREGWRLPDIIDLIEQAIVQGNEIVTENVRYRMEGIRTLGLGCVTGPGIENEHRMAKAWSSFFPPPAAVSWRILYGVTYVTEAFPTVYVSGSVSVSTRACHESTVRVLARESWVRLPARELERARTSCDN